MDSNTLFLAGNNDEIRKIYNKQHKNVIFNTNIYYTLLIYTYTYL